MPIVGFPFPPASRKRSTSSAVGRRAHEAVAYFPGKLSRTRCAGRDHDARGRRRQRVQARILDRVVGAVERRFVAAPQQPDDLDCLLEHLEPHVRRRPTRADDVLVEVLAGADAEKEASGHQRGRRGGCLCNDRRVTADDRAGHAGSELEAMRRLGDAPDDRPDEGALTLSVDPGMKVVGDEGVLEAALLGPRAFATRAEGGCSSEESA